MKTRIYIYICHRKGRINETNKFFYFTDGNCDVKLWKEAKEKESERRGRTHSPSIIAALDRKPEAREISMQEGVDGNVYSYNSRMAESSRFFSLSQKLATRPLI